MLTEDLGEYLRLYDLWSQWKPEEPEGILIAHASIHGNTAYASEALKSKLEGKGAQVTMCDLTATDLSYAVTSAFYCGKLVLACSTYDGGLFPPMKAFWIIYRQRDSETAGSASWKRLMGPCCRAADARRVGKDEGTPTV